jgi:hypothetical protein
MVISIADDRHIVGGRRVRNRHGRIIQDETTKWSGARPAMAFDHHGVSGFPDAAPAPSPAMAQLMPATKKAALEAPL